MTQNICINSRRFAIARHMAVVLMHVGDVRGEADIIFKVGLVQDEEEQIKSGEKGGREVDIFGWAEARVVASKLRVGSCENRCARIECGADTSL